MGFFAETARKGTVVSRANSIGSTSASSVPNTGNSKCFCVITGCLASLMVFRRDLLLYSGCDVNLFLKIVPTSLWMTWFPSCRDPDTKFKISNNDDVWHALYKVKVQSYDSVYFSLKGSLLLDIKGTVLSDIKGHSTIFLRKKNGTLVVVLEC